MDEFEEAILHAYTREPSPRELAYFRDYLAGEITREDIENEFNGTALGSYWDDFRYVYAAHGDDGDVMLEAIRDNIGNRDRDSYSRETLREPESQRGIPELPTVAPKGPGREPLPEPAVPDVGRGRRDRSGNAFLRLARRVRRFFS